MKLGEFINNFSHNNLIRLLYKEDGGHVCVIKKTNDPDSKFMTDFDVVFMDWSVNKSGPYSFYKDHKVLGLAAWESASEWEVDIQRMRDEKLKELGI
jgi:hypothetical protein